MDTLPALKWEKIVAVRELASQVDIELAVNDKQSSRFAAEPDDEYGAPKKAEAHGNDFTSMPETVLLWECLHSQCSKTAMFTLLHCRAEEPLWQDPSLQPTCAAEDWRQQHAVHAQASTEQPHRNGALLWVLAAAWTLSVVMAWRCGASSANPSVDGRAVARTRHLEQLRTSKEIPDVPALDRRVHSSGESGGTVVLPAGSKTAQHWRSPTRMTAHMQAQSMQNSDVDITELPSDEGASAEVGSHQGRQQSGAYSRSTAKRQGSMCTRRQSSLWERTGRRLQRADTSSIGGADPD
ncbi:hypothetical protein COCOBI_04-4690 [Coccomyxa sp. Obi]|nr:hypothetical protein COCOBI_04-4690 [Coccomyxa sp. Obi]